MAPAPPLIWDSRLEAAAERHSRDMAEHGHFDHRGSDGLGTGERVRRAGYDWRVIGENIAARQQSVAEVVGGGVAAAFIAFRVCFRMSRSLPGRGVRLQVAGARLPPASSF